MMLDWTMVEVINILIKDRIQNKTYFIFKQWNYLIITITV